MLKAIVFDFDGVIVDSESLHYRAILRVTQPLGLTLDYTTYLQQFVGYNDRDVFGFIYDELPQPPAVSDRGAGISELCARKELAFEELVTSADIATVPGALALIDEAAACLPIALASGTPLRNINVVLERLAIRDRFATIVATDHVEQSKPDPQTYRLALARLRDAYPNVTFASEECLAIEDTPAGLESAREAGLTRLGLTTNLSSDHLHEAQQVLPNLLGITVDQLQQWHNGLGAADADHAKDANSAS